jgi:hypothetical protein
MEIVWLACKFRPNLYNPVFFNMRFPVFAFCFTLVSCLTYFSFCML